MKIPIRPPVGSPIIEKKSSPSSQAIINNEDDLSSVSDSPDTDSDTSSGSNFSRTRRIGISSFDVSVSSASNASTPPITPRVYIHSGVSSGGSSRSISPGGSSLDSGISVVGQLR